MLDDIRLDVDATNPLGCQNHSERVWSEVSLEIGTIMGALRMRGQRTRWWLKGLVIIGISTLILIGGISQWQVAHARQRPPIQLRTTVLMTTGAQPFDTATSVRLLNGRTSNPVLSARVGYLLHADSNSITPQSYRIKRRAYNVTLIGGVMVGSLVLWLGYHWWRRR